MSPIIYIIRRAQARANAPRIAAHPNPYGVQIHADLPYPVTAPGSALSDDGNPNHLLDVYSPTDSKTPLPVIVELHGGGYLSCFKEINAQHGQYLASKGFHVVNMNYTLCPEGDLSTILNELSAVLGWVKAHADVYGFDLSRVFLTGDSAGGHIVLLAAALFTSGRFADYFGVGQPPIQPAGYAASCPEGSFDFKLLPKNLPSHLLFLILHKYTFDRELVRHTSYEYYMDDAYPRIWFCSSPTDSLLYTHTRGMHEFMEARGIPHVYREYVSRERKLDHVFNVLFPDYPESRQANDDMIAFFNACPSLPSE